MIIRYRIAAMHGSWLLLVQLKSSAEASLLLLHLSVAACQTYDGVHHILHGPWRTQHVRMLHTFPHPGLHSRVARHALPLLTHCQALEWHCVVPILIMHPRLSTEVCSVVPVCTCV
jgi:hypothetical protein